LTLEVYDMSVWDEYPSLTPADLRTLVAVTAQTLMELDADQSVPQDVLQQSTRACAADIAQVMTTTDSSITPSRVQALLEDEALALDACRGVLDGVRGQPQLADRIARAYEVRKQKMTGVETTLLVGALVVLAMRIKRLRFGSTLIEFERSGEAVKTFVSGLTKSVGGPPA
jgi:hypothetical protein